jgi:hypothetical protein
VLRLGGWMLIILESENRAIADEVQHGQKPPTLVVVCPPFATQGLPDLPSGLLACSEGH